MKLLLLRKTNEEGLDTFLGMVSDNIPDRVLEDAIENALIDLSSRIASGEWSADWDDVEAVE